MRDHDVDLERTVLGSVLCRPRPNAETVARLRLTDFIVPAHRFIFAAIADLTRGGYAADIIAVERSLRDMGRLELVGGMATLAAIAACADYRPAIVAWSVDELQALAALRAPS